MSNFSLLKGLHVLVVDDDPDSLELMSVVLNLYEVQVTTALSVSEAKEAISQFVPDLLISDMAMPHEDGYSLIRQVKNLEARQGRLIPAVAVTGLNGEENRLQALKTGFSMYMLKPIDPFELISVIAKLIQSTS